MELSSRPKGQTGDDNVYDRGSFLSAADALSKITGETGDYDDALRAADPVVSRQPILHHTARGENAWADDVQVAEGVTAVLRAYQKACPASVILLHGLLPRADHPNDPTRLKIKRINAIISKPGDGNKVVYLDFGDRFLRPDGTRIHDLMPASLHPSAKGYEVWADSIRPTLDKAFRAGSPAP